MAVPWGRPALPVYNPLSRTRGSSASSGSIPLEPRLAPPSPELVSSATFHSPRSGLSLLSLDAPVSPAADVDGLLRLSIYLTRSLADSDENACFQRR